MGTDYDHTSFAVHDSASWAMRLRDELGAVTMSEASLDGFAYLMVYIGDDEQGSQLELIAPTADGFLTRFLDKHGEGPHHITFTVSDLPSAVAAVRELGVLVVGENYDNPEWQEAFLFPDTRHGVVIQLAQTTVVYPSRAELSALRTGDRAARLGPTHLGSTDPEFSRRLFEEVLGGVASRAGEAILYRWPGGAVMVHPREVAGVFGVSLENGPDQGFAIGSVSFTL